MSPARRLGIVLSVALPLTLGPGIAIAGAATAAGGCTSNPASAINQYCETIPAATGAKPPVAGSPTLATALPRGIVRKINAPHGSATVGTLQARRRLLTLPAPAGAPQPARPHDKRVGAAGSGPSALSGPDATKRASIAGGPSVWSLFLTLILILVAIALALGATAFLRSRHQRRAA